MCNLDENCDRAEVHRFRSSFFRFFPAGHIAFMRSADVLIIGGPRQHYILLHVGVEGVRCGRGEIGIK